MLEKAVGALPLGFAQAEGVLDSAGSSLSYDWELVANVFLLSQLANDTLEIAGPTQSFRVLRYTSTTNT